jgi:DNA-binding GntR family transcriptional regulator
MEADPQSFDWVDRNRVFHMAVFDTTASPRLATMIRNQQDASLMCIGASLQNQPWLRVEANHDQAAIRDARERKVADAAVEALEHHLRTSIDAFDKDRD